MKVYWGNFKTGEHDYRETPTGDEVLAYIPQWPAAQNLYKLHLEMGKTEAEAMELTLKACVGR